MRVRGAAARKPVARGGQRLPITRKPPREEWLPCSNSRCELPLEARGLCLVPFLLFFLHCHVKLDGVETDYFQLRAAIITLDNITFIRIFVHLNLSLAFGARSSRHRVYSSVMVARDIHQHTPVVAT
jgi:hypothetical protein